MSAPNSSPQPNHASRLNQQQHINTAETTQPNRSQTHHKKTTKISINSKDKPTSAKTTLPHLHKTNGNHKLIDKSLQITHNQNHTCLHFK
jgi:hypothetical protein